MGPRGQDSEGDGTPHPTRTPASQFYRPPKGWPPEPPREESSGDFRAILVPRAPDQLAEAT